MRHAHFHSTTPPTPSLSRSSSSLLSRGSLPLGAKILRSSTPRALLRRSLTVELQIVIFVVFVVVFVGVVLCLTFVIIIIVVSNSNFRISTTISRIRATLVPLHSSSRYQSITTTTSAKRRYFVLRSCCGTPQEHLSITLLDVSQSILYV